MLKVNKEELVKGDIIICQYDTTNYITEFDNLKETISNFISDGKKFYRGGSFRFEKDCKFIRMAEPSEIAWFKQCNKANRFIPFENINFNIELNYEIC